MKLKTTLDFSFSALDLRIIFPKVSDDGLPSKTTRCREKKWSLRRTQDGLGFSTEKLHLSTK